MIDPFSVTCSIIGLALSSSTGLLSFNGPILTFSSVSITNYNSVDYQLGIRFHILGLSKNSTKPEKENKGQDKESKKSGENKVTNLIDRLGIVSSDEPHGSANLGSLLLMV